MEFKSKYVAHPTDAHGFVSYSDEENWIWNFLYNRQVETIAGRAAPEYTKGIEQLALSATGIPQLPTVSERLQQASNWSVSPVAALISAAEFFTLLASRRFPAATFIRIREEIDYVTEPDIFHELFGHCPMLTQPVYADFVADYAKMVLQSDERDWLLLQRFFWFTVEFGLIKTTQGVKAFGGGILSSPGETVYSVESTVPERRPFNAVDIFRTPYRIDQVQPIYYVIENYEQLFDFVNSDVSAVIAKARSLGEFAPTFKLDSDPQNIHINCC